MSRISNHVGSEVLNDPTFSYKNKEILGASVAK